MSEVTEDTLFLACTRPAMRWGVPMEGYYINLFGTFILGMVLGSPLWWGLFFVFHLPMVWQANRDPNFFREFRVWLDTRGGNLDGIMLAAPVRRALDKREVMSSV